MMQKLDRQYVLSAAEIRDAIFYYLANAHNLPVPDRFDQAVISWDETHKVYISWDHTADLPLS